MNNTFEITINFRDGTRVRHKGCTSLDRDHTDKFLEVAIDNPRHIRNYVYALDTILDLNTYQQK